MIGQTYNRLTITGPAASHPHGGVQVTCVCTCGTEKVVVLRKLLNGKAKSCGCMARETTQRIGTMNLRHGHARHHSDRSGAYRSWQAMLQRAKGSPSRKDREWYEGVSVCERWLVFENFLADMGERPDKHTLDRYPNRAGNYEPGNCRWATMKQQAANRRPRRKARQ